MPIHAPIPWPRWTEAAMREIDYPVMAQAFATHRELGRLCDKGIFQADRAERLAVAGPGPNITFHAVACTPIDRSLGV